MKVSNNNPWADLPNNHLFKDFDSDYLKSTIQKSTKYTFKATSIDKELFTKKVHFVELSDASEFLKNVHSFALEMLDDGTEYFNSDMDLFIKKALELCRHSEIEKNHPVILLLKDNEKKEVLTPKVYSKEVLSPLSQHFLFLSFFDIKSVTPKDLTIFLDKTYSYVNLIYKNSKYYNKDLDVFIDKVKSEYFYKSKTSIKEDHPLIVLQNLNRDKPKVVVKSILKTSVVNQA